MFNLFIIIQFSMFERSLYGRFIESTEKVLYVRSDYELDFIVLLGNTRNREHRKHISNIFVSRKISQPREKS